MWLAQAPFERPVTVRWTRASTPMAGAVSGDVADVGVSVPASQSVTLDDAVWRQRGDAHYVSYEEETEARVTLKLQEARVTMIRHGSAQWNARFKAGTKSTSMMYVSGQGMPIEIETKSLHLTVTDAGGSMDTIYTANIGGHIEQVHLELTFEVLES